MADVFVRHRRSQTRSRERHFGEIPLSTGEIEYLTRQDEATRRRQRLLQVREQEKRAAQLVTQRYRDNLRRLQSYKLQLAQRDHRHQQDTVLSALHEKYQCSLQGIGTAQRNAREKMIELMELAQLEQDKWSVNRRGEKLRFQDAVEIEHEDASVRLARRREIERNLKRLKEMSLKHRSEASARAQRELEQELKLQKAQEDAQWYRAQHLEAEEFSFPRKTPKDVTAYQFTRTHCVAVPGSGSALKSKETPKGQATFREVKVIRHNRNTQQTTNSAIDQAEVYRKEMELKQENEWRMREQQAKVAGSRGQDALQTVESIHEGARVLEWLMERELQARVEKAAQLDGEHVKNEPHRVELQQAEDSGSEAFARMFGIEEDSAGVLDDSFGDKRAHLDGHPERIAARRAGSISASDDSWLVDEEWRTPSEQFDAEEDEDIPPVVRAPAERMVDQKIGAMHDLLKKVASYGEARQAQREDEVTRQHDETDHRGVDALRHRLNSRERYDEWRTAQGLASPSAVNRNADREIDTSDAHNSASQRVDDALATDDDALNQSTGSAQIGRHERLDVRPQQRIDSQAQQTRHSPPLAVGTSTSGQAQAMARNGRVQSEAAARRATQSALGSDHRRSPNGSETFQRDGEEGERPSPTAGGRAEEFGGSGQWSNSTGRHQWQGSSRRTAEQFDWFDEGFTAGLGHRDDQNPSAERDDDDDQGSRHSKVDSRQESIDELEERLQQALEQRQASQRGRTERLHLREDQEHESGDQNSPAATPSDREQTLQSGTRSRHSEGAWASSRRASHSNRRGGGSQTSDIGEFPQNEYQEGGENDGEHGPSDGAESDSFQSDGKRDRLQWNQRLQHEWMDGDENDLDKGHGSPANEGGGIIDVHGDHSAGISEAPRLATSPISQRSHQRQSEGGRAGELGVDYQRDDEYTKFEYQDESFLDQPSIENRSQQTPEAALAEVAVKPGRPSRDRDSSASRGNSVAHNIDGVAGLEKRGDTWQQSERGLSAQDLKSNVDQGADDQQEGVNQASGPSAVVALDESEDASDFDSSMLFTEEMAGPGGMASYLRQMQQQGIAMQSDSSSIPQYSLPLSDSFSSMNDSVIEADGGVAALTNQLLPMFPRQLRRMSDMSATTDELRNQNTTRHHDVSRGPARGEAAILVKGLAQQDDRATDAATTGVETDAPATTRVKTHGEDHREERVQQDISQLQRDRGAPAEDLPRGPLHDLSFSSDSSSDMSAFIYLTRMRKVASMGTPGSRSGEAPPPATSSQESLSGLSSLSSTPVHPSMPRATRTNTRPETLVHDNRRDSVGSSSSSSPSIDARFQYLVNMTAVAGKALPLHMNLPPKDLSRSDMRFPPPQVKLNVYSSDSDDDDGDSQAGGQQLERQHADQASTTEAERRDLSHRGQNDTGRTQYPLPAAPFGQLDLSNPPAPAFGSSSSSSSSSNKSARSEDNKSDRRSHGFGASHRDDEPVEQFALEELSKRLAGLPPPPFGSFDMSQPPDPLAWRIEGEHDDNASSAFGSEANSSQITERKDAKNLRQAGLDAQAPLSEASSVMGASPHKKGEALFVPLETGASETSAAGSSLADAFRQRHPNFHRRAQETNQSLLEQRREQLAARRAGSSAPASVSQLRQPSIRVTPKAKAPPSPARSRTSSTMSMPPPALLDRLATGERAKISAQEMKDRTLRLYRQLPEVAERKRQEDVLERRRQRLAEMREREKLRRQQQRQR